MKVFKRENCDIAIALTALLAAIICLTSCDFEDDGCIEVPIGQCIEFVEEEEEETNPYGGIFE